MPVIVSIIVVNWNSGQLTVDAITPYLNYSSAFVECRLIIIDNASSDTSVSILEQLPVTLIINKNNMGFGHACNQAYPYTAGSDYILLLNPDTKSNPDVLEKLVSFLENNPTYAVTGPAQYNGEGSLLRSCGRFPTFKTAIYEVLGLSKILPQLFTPAPLMTEWNHSYSTDVDHIMGSYMLIRKPVLEQTGFMDEIFFVYAEDIDLSKRIANAGYKSFYYKECRIFHAAGGSGNAASKMRLFYSLSARRLYWRKHLGAFATFVLTLLSVFPEPFIRLIKSPKQIATIAGAYMLYFKK